MLKFVAFMALALTGAALAASEPAYSAGGMRGFAGGRTGIPFRFAPRPRFVHVPRLGFARAGFGKARTPFIAPLTPRPFATTIPLRPFARLARRHRWINQNGWNFPVTSTDWGYGFDAGYIGTPYDPAETIPVYGPAPAADPPPPMTARAAGASDENRDGCRAERVTVPSGATGERTITVVRC
jgi:hypothetical protein